MMTMMTVFLMTNPMSIMTKKTAISPSQNGSLNIRSSRETWFSHFDNSNKQTCDKNLFVLLWKIWTRIYIGRRELEYFIAQLKVKEEPFVLQFPVDSFSGNNACLETILSETNLG